MVSTVNAASSGGAIRQAIFRAASGTGVDFNYLYNQARVESSFDPNARARTSSATGLYQFIEQSWLGVVAKHGDAHGLGWATAAIRQGTDGRYRVADPQTRAAILDLRRDPTTAAAMAAEFASDNRDTLESRLGRSVETVDLYLAHFLGAAGAVKFLRSHDASPDTPAAAIFPAAARSNRSIFFSRDGASRSLRDVRERFAAKLGTSAPPVRPEPADRPSVRWAERLERPEATSRVAEQGRAQAHLAYLMLASLGVTA